MSFRPRVVACWRARLSLLTPRQCPSLVSSRKRAMCSLNDYGEPGYEFVHMDEDEFLIAEIQKFARKRPHQCSLQEILDMKDTSKLAKFIHQEVPVRYAERIRDIESVPDWRQDADLAKLHEHHIEVFQGIRLLQKRKKLNYSSLSSLSAADIMMTFDEVVQYAHKIGSTMPRRVTRGLHRLHKSRSDEFTTEFVDKWLDDFLLNWIGSEALLMQYIACKRGRTNGIIDPHCDVAEVCRNTASIVQEMCEDIYGLRPHIIVESFSAVEADQRAPSFSYIPMFLQFVMQEILKNCCRATLDTCPPEKLSKRPTTIAVCADEQQVAIRISDRGRGIPFHVGDKVWSYMYSTGCKTKPKHADYKGDGPTPLAGFGFGLPLSRLYCRYLGGWLRVVSWPGYGVDVHLSLPRLSSQQIEVVPDLEHEKQEKGHFINGMPAHVEDAIANSQAEKGQFIKAERFHEKS